MTMIAWIAISLWTSTIAFFVGGCIGFECGKKDEAKRSNSGE